MAKRSSRELRLRRQRRVRVRVRGTSERPRLAVFRSNMHIYAQVIDDSSGITLAAASTVDKTLRTASQTKSESSREVGRLIAERAKSAGVAKVVFDRGGFRYHGRIQALADGAREAGLEF